MSSEHKNRTNHQDNLRHTTGLFWHGRYYEAGQVKPNEKKKRGQWLLRRKLRIPASPPSSPRRS